MEKKKNYLLGLILPLLVNLSNCFGVIVGETPITVIRAENDSKLDRPESVAFTPSGDCLAVANSLANSVTFYKRVGGEGYVYETKPSYTIEGLQSQLDYPHDLSFSPDGKHLAVANRVGNSITIYKRDLSLNRYESHPIASIQGSRSQISFPDAVRFSPVENVIAVANMYSHTITLYHFQGDHYDRRPFQVLTHRILQIPDGLDFSKDGQLLAVTSHDSHSVVLYQRKEGSQGFYVNTPIQALQGPQTLFCFPHSVAFHPVKNDLTVSCSQGRKNVHFFSTTESGLYATAPELSLEILEMYDESTIHLLDQLHQEGGVKGIAFTPDGKGLAITQNLCQDSLRLPFPVGVLAIYPVSVEAH